MTVSAIAQRLSPGSTNQRSVVDGAVNSGGGVVAVGSGDSSHAAVEGTGTGPRSCTTISVTEGGAAPMSVTTIIASPTRTCAASSEPWATPLLVQVGNRGGEHSQSWSPKLADGGVVQPCVGTNERRAEDGGWAFGEVDEAHDARVIEARQEVCLMTETGAACRVVGRLDGDESIVVVADRDVRHEIAAIIIIKHETT